MTRRGWFDSIPGQTGDRSLEEQVAALRPAIAECRGKTILDLGAAEGLISREFAAHGAKKVIAIEAVAGHVAVGVEICKNYPVEFELADLNGAAQMVYHCDIVLCLGIAHKLRDPAVCIKFAADSATDLVLIRGGRALSDEGIITSKFLSDMAPGEEQKRMTCDAFGIMKSRGFELERTEVGPPPHSEKVYYFRKVRK